MSPALPANVVQMYGSSATQTNGTLKAEQLVTVDKLTAKVSARKEADK